jgi:hypothetical protein
MFDDLIQNIEEEQTNESLARAAALSVFAVHKPRIFEEGRNAEDKQIGEYVDGYYKEKRRKMGRETGFVNLSMTEAMKKDYQVSDSGTVGYGFSNQVQSDKADYNEERYGAIIFGLTEKEAELYVELFAKNLGFK